MPAVGRQPRPSTFTGMLALQWPPHWPDENPAPASGFPAPLPNRSALQLRLEDFRGGFPQQGGPPVQDNWNRLWRTPTNSSRYEWTHRSTEHRLFLSVPVCSRNRAHVLDPVNDCKPDGSLFAVYRVCLTEPRQEKRQRIY